MRDDNLKIMGILNLTPDSFYDGGRFFDDNKVDADEALYYVKSLIEDGADVIDIGGESTRPGFTPISADEELSRIIDVLKKIKENFDVPVSVDTYKPEVAKEAILSGADIINDIGFLPPNMLELIAENEIKYCLMHNRNGNAYKRDEKTITIEELNGEIHEKLRKIYSYGIERKNIIIDPGIGFGKSNADDIMILKNMEALKVHNYPVLIGASNKSFIDYIHTTDKNERLEGTLAVTAKAFYSDIDYIRVHDVKANRKFLDMLRAIR